MQATLSAVRSILIGIGGVLAAQGITSVGGFSVQTIIGGIMMVAPLIWGIAQKYAAERATVARTTVAVQAGVAASQAGSGLIPSSRASSITPVQAQAIIAAHAPLVITTR
jgi:hypothetical protein